MTLKIIWAVMEIFGVFGVGWLARHFGYLKEQDLERWTAFIIDFLFPLLVFHAILSGFRAEEVRELWPLPVLGLGSIVFGAILGIGFRPFVASKDPALRRTFHHFCAMNNFGFLPVIIVQSLWADAGLANLFLFNLGSQVGYWTIGVMLLGETHPKAALKSVVQPPTIALAVALVLCFTGLDGFVPTVVRNISKSAGAAAIPAQLCVIGASLYPLPRITFKRDIAYLTILRLAVIPALAVGVILMLPLALPVRQIALVVALMPVAVSTVIMARRYGGCPEYAAQAAVVTTLVSMVTIPLGMRLLLRFIQDAPG